MPNWPEPLTSTLAGQNSGLNGLVYGQFSPVHTARRQPVRSLLSRQLNCVTHGPELGSHSH